LQTPLSPSDMFLAYNPSRWKQCQRKLTTGQYITQKYESKTKRYSERESRMGRESVREEKSRANTELEKWRQETVHKARDTNKHMVAMNLPVLIQFRC